jgi:hypothetical protein
VKELEGERWEAVGGCDRVLPWQFVQGSVGDEANRTAEKYSHGEESLTSGRE